MTTFEKVTNQPFPLTKTAAGQKTQAIKVTDSPKEDNSLAEIILAANLAIDMTVASGKPVNLQTSLALLNVRRRDKINKDKTATSKK